MSFKKILGILVFLAGIAMMGASLYIKSQVEDGKLQIAAGQKKVDQANSLFSVVPGTKVIGKTVTQSGQSKIDAGQAQVDYYEALAKKLQMGGIVLTIVGVGILVLWRTKKQK